MIPAPGTSGQAHLQNLKATLGYTGSLRSVWATGDPASGAPNEKTLLYHLLRPSSHRVLVAFVGHCGDLTIGSSVRAQ